MSDVMRYEYLIVSLEYHYCGLNQIMCLHCHSTFTWGYYVNTSDATHTQHGWAFTMVVQHSSSLSTLDMYYALLRFNIHSCSSWNSNYSTLIIHWSAISHYGYCSLLIFVLSYHMSTINITKCQMYTDSDEKWSEKMPWMIAIKLS